VAFSKINVNNYDTSQKFGHYINEYTVESHYTNNWDSVWIEPNNPMNGCPDKLSSTVLNKYTSRQNTNPFEY